MPSDAKILREQGIEGLRAFWREKANRYYATHRIDQRAYLREAKRRYNERQGLPHRLCRAGCGTKAPDDLVIHGSYWCDSCKQRCEACGQVMARSRGRFCSRACYWSQVLRVDQRIGKSCSIRFTTCTECQRLFTQHGSLSQFCSDDCRRLRAKVQMREYFRTTRKTATSYWRIADTPEAREIAEMYFELRMELRPSAKWKERYREYRAAKRQRDPEHAVGAGAESA